MWKHLTTNRLTVERIGGEDYPADILPMVGTADYDMNILFHCVKQGEAKGS